MADRLVVKAQDDEKFYNICGPYEFITISQVIDEFGQVDYGGKHLQEAWSSAPKAIRAAKIRCKQGYRVDVYHRIAISAGY